MINPTYPGVYIEEIPSGVHPITGVATSITAMVGRTKKGPLRTPVRVQSVGEYARVFGPLWKESPLSYSIQHFFQNGGTDAVIVRLHRGALPATWTEVPWIQLETGSGGKDNPGDWGSYLSIETDRKLDPDRLSDPTQFNLIVRLHSEKGDMSIATVKDALNKKIIATESFRNLSTDPGSSRYFRTVLAAESQFVKMLTGFVRADPPPAASAQEQLMMTPGGDGDRLQPGDYAGDEDNKNGFYALEDADLFNLLYFPPMFPGDGGDVPVDLVLNPALAYCQEKRRAMLIVDPIRSWNGPAAVASGIGPDLRDLLGGASRSKNAMLYYPWLHIPDPLQENRLERFAPGAAMAGIIARTDSERGVWKAPAGIDAGLGGVRAMEYKLTDGENGQLNPLGVNCLRTKVPYGHIAWGARTLAGDDRFASEWKYIPIRRTALYIEESLFRGLHWVVFEPNDEPLWGQIRMNTKAFMQNLFKKGAFQGTTPKEAFFVKCDRENNPQSQIDLGIVTVTVGFAPLKPAEFVIIQIQQMAGQLEA